MEHKTLADLQAVADIQVVDRSARMSRDERRRRRAYPIANILLTTWGTITVVVMAG